MTDSIPTAPVTELYDAELYPPPLAKKLIVYSKYGVTTAGVFQPGFHVAWGYCPKVPASVKERLSKCRNS